MLKVIVLDTCCCFHVNGVIHVACHVMFVDYGKDGDPTFSLPQYWARFEVNTAEVTF